jgi:tetratricopeptide (TPR) repeat protein
MSSDSMIPPSPRLVVGRDEVLAGASDVLLRPAGRDRAVALFGPAGVGKTTVALELARRLAPGFTDGQAWIDGSLLEVRRSGQQELAMRLMQAVGGEHELSPGSVASAQSMLRHRRLLVVIDGVEDAGQVLDLLPDCESPSALILTSRTRLRLDIATFSLSPLSPEQSRELLLRVLDAPSAVTDPWLLDELLHVTGGLPFAIAMAGALLAQHTGSTEELLHQLRNEVTRSSFVETPTTTTTVGMSSVLAASYAQLRPSSAALLRAIALLPGDSFTLTVLQQATNVDLDALAELVASAFVESEGDTYWTHPIVRRFAREQLGDADVDALTARLATAHLTAPDLDNTLSSHHTQNLVGLHREPSDRIEAQEYALRLATSGGDAAAEARALANLGALYLGAGHLDDAAAALQAALDAGARAGDVSTSAKAALSLGHIERNRGDVDKAEQLYVLSTRSFAELADAQGQARALASLGDLYAEQRRFEQAGHIYQEALGAMSSDDGDVRAHVEGRLAYIAQADGDIDRARTLYRAALQHANDDGERGDLWFQLAILEANETNSAAASELLERAIDAHLRAGHLHRAARPALALGALEVERGELERAMARFEEADELVKDAGEERLGALAVYGLGRTAQEMSRGDEASRLLELALALFRETNGKLGEAHALDALVTALQRSGDVAEARAAEADAEALFRQLGVQAPTSAASSLRMLMLSDSK